MKYLPGKKSKLILLRDGQANLSRHWLNMIFSNDASHIIYFNKTVQGTEYTRQIFRLH